MNIYKLFYYWCLFIKVFSVGLFRQILFMIYMMYEFSVDLKKPYSQLHDYLKFFWTACFYYINFYSCTSFIRSYITIELIFTSLVMHIVSHGIISIITDPRKWETCLLHKYHDRGSHHTSSMLIISNWQSEPATLP